MTNNQKRMYWIYILSFAFDFRGDEGGSPIQVVYLVVGLVSSFLLFVSGKNSENRHQYKTVIIIWWLYLISTVLSFCLNNLLGTSDITFEHYIRLVCSCLLCGMSLLSISTIGANASPREIILPVIFLCIVSSIFRLLFAIYDRGVAIDSARYQILSPAIPVLVAFGIADLIISRKPTGLGWLATVLTGSLVILSVTRAFIITIIMCIIGCFFIMFKIRNNMNKKLLHRVWNNIIPVLILVSVSCLIASFFRPDIIENWERRIFNARTGNSADTDITFLARVSASSGLWQAVNEQPFTLLFGKGLGASYRWDPAYSVEISKVFPFPYGEFWSSADSMIIYTIFSSGMVFGILVFVFYFIALFKSYAVAKNAVSIVGSTNLSFFVFPYICIISFISQMFSSNPGGERLGGQLIGLVVGIICWQGSYIESLGRGVTRKNLVSEKYESGKEID